MSDNDLDDLLKLNRSWAKSMVDADEQFFTDLCDQQQPKYLWIGCSDSRVPAAEIVGLKPGEMFVHRNIANVVPHSDLNCLAVIQYAVEVLDVEHIIVTGHYGCGGINAAMEKKDHGQIDNWLAHIKDIYRLNYDRITALPDPEDRANLLCELNVSAQVRNVAKTSIVQNAWREGKSLKVHGWVYSLKDGILQDLKVGIGSAGQLHDAYRITAELE
ncbi:MAG: carbonate dehydratase [Kordiimonadales bacterium]|nr:MAG: carbonate dehydratase [Kordiimonadales bacterium]